MKAPGCKTNRNNHSAMLARSYSWKRLEERWNKIQVGRQGSYSIERLESLDLYCKTTSRIRVILVCLCTPLPALAVAILLEALPLQPPSEGWSANWVFWLRLFLMEMVLGSCGNWQTATFVPGVDFTLSKRVVVALLVSTAYVGTCILAARMIGFPVPFMMQFGAVPVGIYTPLMIRIVLGPALFAQDSPFKVLGDRYNRFFFAHMTLIGVYPIYKVLYSFMPSSYLSVVVIILPLWKFAAKKFVVRSSRELEDCIPEFVAFSVDFFGTLFVSVCMYTSGSLYLSGLFILTDVSQSFLEFREIRGNAQILLGLLRDRCASQIRLQTKSSRRISLLDTNNELLSTLTAVVREPKNYEINTLQGARLWSCLPHPITQEQANLLRRLEESGVYGPANASRATTSMRLRQPHYRYIQPPHIAVAPSSESLPENAGLAVTSEDTKNSRRPERSKMLTLQGLQLLFHCEYWALVKYVECVVPLVFATYKITLLHLPNAVYYPKSDTQWGGSAFTNLVAFGLLEVATFVLFNVFFQNKFSFSALYQLAFVLETQLCPVQVHLFVALLLLLQYELFHFGADFTLEFAWLKDKHQ